MSKQFDSVSAFAYDLPWCAHDARDEMGKSTRSWELVRVAAGREQSRFVEDYRRPGRRSSGHLEVVLPWMESAGRYLVVRRSASIASRPKRAAKASRTGHSSVSTS